ncbi:MAG: gliding motility protein GldM [Cytophagaceae bacterium]|nr:gliding motility protein GldM [Cytophagaceae bacterium]
MAGAKETPRQKMIGMMYLVLTAMLALQVSSALIEKFTLLNRSLETANASSSERNQNDVTNIKETVAKSSNPALYQDVLKKADEVRQVSNAMVGEIDAIKTEIIQDAGGGLDEQGNINNPKEEERVAILMVGNSNRKGKAYPLKDRMNQYVLGLSKYADPGTKFAPLALDAREDPIANLSTEQRRKDFAELNFAQTPVPAALAVLSQKQSEIRRYENTVLDQLAAKVGAKEVKFDKIFGMISAKSNTVVAGTPFEAEMFIAASSSGITPRMSFNGAAVPVKDGKAIIKFTAQGGAYDSKGLARKVYTGNISYNDPSGQTKTLTVTGEYFVAKATYSIESGTLPPLYLACANKLNFVSPQLGALWQPSFPASGAQIISGGGGKLTIVPNSNRVSMRVVNQGNVLGEENFKVRLVPKPDIVVFSNGAPVNEKQGMSASSLRSIDVRAVADPDFKATNPEDAQYRVTEVIVSLVRGNRRIGNISLSGGGSISGLAQTAQAGDRYVVEVKGCQRKNFQGNISPVNIGNRIVQISLN